MKEHLTIKLREPRAADVPFWRDFIADKSVEVERLHPTFDAELARSGLRFWVTSEYAPAGRRWSPEEAAAGLDRIVRVILRDDRELPDELIARIRLIPEFECVCPIDVGEADLPVPVPALALELGPAVDRSRDLVHLRHARLFGRGHPGVKVAVLDTGVNLDHPETRSRIVGQADFVHIASEGARGAAASRGVAQDGPTAALDTRGFIGDFMEYDGVAEDEVGHGTHVTGIVAGQGLRMPAGVVPDCSVLVVRVLATMRSGDRLVGAGIVDNINAGIKWAVDQGADVINMSLGIRHSGGGLPHADVIRYALARGVTVVAASGNDGTDEKYYPGALPGVIAVGATDASGAVARFSSYGAPVWIVAPGSNVYSSYANGGYTFASGTSQAAPFVTGAVALLKSQALSRGVRLGDAAVKEILRHTADKPDQHARSPRSGFGMLNLLDACRLLDQMLEADLHAAA